MTYYARALEGYPPKAYLAFYGNRFSRFTRRKVNQPLQRLIDREYIQAMPSGQGSRRQKVVLDSSMHPGRPQCTGRPTGAISFCRQLFPLAILKGAYDLGLLTVAQIQLVWCSLRGMSTTKLSSVDTSFLIHSLRVSFAKSLSLKSTFPADFCPTQSDVSGTLDSSYSAS